MLNISKSKSVKYVQKYLATIFLPYFSTFIYGWILENDSSKYAYQKDFKCNFFLKKKMVPNNLLFRPPKSAIWHDFIFCCGHCHNDIWPQIGFLWPVKCCVLWPQWTVMAPGHSSHSVTLNFVSSGHNDMWHPSDVNNLSVTCQMLWPLSTINFGGLIILIASL